MAKRRRILEKLIINEISGVDHPCQEGAQVAIMKRKASNTMNDELEGSVLDLEARIQALTKAVAAVTDKKDFDPFKRVGVPDFDSTVSEIRKRDNCSRTEALAKARVENPQAFEEYQNVDVVGEVIAKASGRHPFEKVVDAIMEQDGVSRSVAMSRARKKEPVKYAAYQLG
jgi:hypothetical protein